MLDLVGLALPKAEEGDCGFMFTTTMGGESGTFDLTTARIPPSSTELTFVTANFRDFHPDGGESYFLSFDGGAVDNENQWLPAQGQTTSLKANRVTLPF